MSVITIQEKSVTLSAINRSDTASTTTWMSTCRLLTNYPLLRLSNRIPFLAICPKTQFLRSISFCL